mmetsp:Transcript_21825/g.58813  ORF Transcript_21825/g.58813 Transcript_21825/m.58813 type:complete len:217 (+) Transcript_21825:98-748(+)
MSRRRPVRQTCLAACLTSSSPHPGQATRSPRTTSLRSSRASMWWCALASPSRARLSLRARSTHATKSGCASTRWAVSSNSHARLWIRLCFPRQRMEIGPEQTSDRQRRPTCSARMATLLLMPATRPAPLGQRRLPREAGALKLLAPLGSPLCCLALDTRGGSQSHTRDLNACAAATTACSETRANYMGDDNGTWVLGAAGPARCRPLGPHLRSDVR